MGKANVCYVCGRPVTVTAVASTCRATVRCRSCGLSMKKSYKGDKRIGNLVKDLITEDWNRGTEQRQSAPADDREGALPGTEAAYPGPEKVSGDVFIIDQKEGEINGDQTRLLGRAPGEHPL